MAAAIIKLSWFVDPIATRTSVSLQHIPEKPFRPIYSRLLLQCPISQPPPSQEPFSLFSTRSTGPASVENVDRSGDNTLTLVQGALSRFIAIPHRTFNKLGLDPEDACAHLAAMSLDMLSVGPWTAMTNTHAYIEGIHQDVPAPSLESWAIELEPSFFGTDSTAYDTDPVKSFVMLSRQDNEGLVRGSFVQTDEDGLSYFKARKLRTDCSAVDSTAPVDSIRCYMTAKEAREMSEAVKGKYLACQAITDRPDNKEVTAGDEEVHVEGASVVS